MGADAAAVAFDVDAANLASAWPKAMNNHNNTSGAIMNGPGKDGDTASK
jgi:hypothetical protein